MEMDYLNAPLGGAVETFPEDPFVLLSSFHGSSLEFY